MNPDPTNQLPRRNWNELVEKAVVAQDAIDGDKAVNRQLRLGQRVVALQAAIDEGKETYAAARADAAARRKVAKGKAEKSNVETPARPPEITGSIREIYRRAGLDYALCMKAKYVHLTVERFWSTRDGCTLGVKAVQLVFECAQRIRANAASIEKAAPKARKRATARLDVEAELDAHIPRLIADLVAGTSVDRAKRKHKQPTALGRRLHWTAEGWSTGAPEPSAAEPRRAALPADFHIHEDVEAQGGRPRDEGIQIPEAELDAALAMLPPDEPSGDDSLDDLDGLSDAAE